MNDPFQYLIPDNYQACKFHEHFFKATGFFAKVCTLMKLRPLQTLFPYLSLQLHSHTIMDQVL